MSIRTSVVALVASCGLLTPEAGTAQDADAMRLVAGSAVNLRAGPAIEAERVKRLEIGSRLRVLSRSTDEHEIDGTRAPWFEVVDERDGVRGWVFGALTAPFDPDSPHRAFEALVEDRATKSENDDFRTLVALERAIRAVEEAYRESAELEVLRLRVVDAVAYGIFGMPPRARERRAWIDAHIELLGYFESGGYYYVRPEAYGDIAERYPTSSVADRMAWEGAQPAPSHCEDDANCWLVVGFEALRRYLERFPDGAYADSAVSRLSDFSGIAADYACWNERTGEPRVDPGVVRDIRGLLAQVPSTLSRAVLEDLETIEEKCARPL